MDCSYNSDSSAPPNTYVILIIVSLAVATVVLALVFILYLLYCRHGKKSSRDFVQLHEINNDDHYGNTINDEPTVQPAQEAGDQVINYKFLVVKN